MARKKKRKTRVLKATVDPVKKPYQQIAYTPVQLQELKRCSEDILYFIENYVYIVDPVRGNVLFKMHDYQKEILKGFMENRNTIVMAGRQLGKSTVSVAYLLWEAMFKSEQTILIVSNVFSAAGEIMERIRYSYELLPDWLKPGVSVYNKSSITFDNKSRVIARATTKNSGRGLSLSVLYVDELSAVDSKKAKEFWSAVRPTLSTGGKCVITSTPSSDEDLFAQLWRASLNTFDDHGAEIPGGVGRNGFKAIKFTWSAHPDRDEAWESNERAAMGDDEKFEREHNCNFIGADETLINAFALAALKGKDPVETTGSVRWYHRPQPNRSYLIGLDPSMGTGNDYAAIQVFQLPEMLQVAEWQHNKTAIPQQVKILREIIKYIQETQKVSGHKGTENEIYWTVENNSIGEAANIVIREIGEDVIGGVYLSQPTKGTGVRRKGYTMTNKLKLEACARLKSLIERDKMHISSKALISQLKTFISRGASYAAKGSEHDDLVMACLLIIKMLERVMTYDDIFRENFSESVEDGETGTRVPLWGVF
jgi:hypothetical protein